MSVAHKNQQARAAAREKQTADVARRSRWALALRYWLPLATLFFLALALRLYRLDAQPLWLDEGETWRTVTTNHVGTLLVGLFRPTEAYPLFHLVLKVCTRLFGDGEWALRLPSAIAGALAVPALFALGYALRGWVLGWGAALLLLPSPFALWQAQDAKAYSLTLLVAILLALTFVHAGKTQRRSAWLRFAAVAAAAPFTHRLLLFTLVSCALAWALTTEHPRRRWVLVGAGLMGLGIVAALAFSLRYRGASGQFAVLDPLTAGWLTFSQFAVGQGPGTVRKLWLLPFGVLTLLGGLRLAWDISRGRYRASAMLVLVAAAFPALLFAMLLLVQPAYEARYFTIVFPFWLLILAWSLPEIPARLPSPTSRRLPVFGMLACGVFGLIAALLVSSWALYLPTKGLFSGARVKEDYRGAVRELAGRVHPDDLVIVHPDTILPLYDYYAPRVASQPLPQPLTYGWLGRANTDRERELRELDSAIRADLARYKRAWLLIAPDHAAVVDKPKPGDELGLVGLAFQYGDHERRLQCNNPAFSRYVGVWLGCNNMPSVNGAVPQPEVVQPAVFGDALRLRGYTITPFPGGIRPGGTLPLTLFWEPLRSLAGTNYIVFVHLTPVGDPRPLVQLDGPPLEGGLPTTFWTDPGAQLHDDRTLQLPNDLPAGRYQLLLGVYRAEDGERLQVSGTTQPVFNNAVLLGEVELQPGAETP